MEVQILTPQPWTLVRGDVTSDGQVRTTRKIAQLSTTESHRKLTRENITHIWGLSSMVEQRAENPRVKGSTPFVSTISEYSAVGSATALGAVGRWFESSYSDQIGVSSNGKTWVFGA